MNLEEQLKKFQMNLIPPNVLAMMKAPGWYLCGDTKDNTKTVPILSTNGELWSIQKDQRMNPTGFLPTLTIHGPFNRPKPVGEEDAGRNDD